MQLGQCTRREGPLPAVIGKQDLTTNADGRFNIDKIAMINSTGRK
jgi:hypothetical protein